MQRLSISLIFVVIIAVVGTGWLVGVLYAQLQDHRDDRSSEMRAYERTGYLLVKLLDGTHSDAAMSERLRESLAGASRPDFKAEIVALTDLPLPAALRSSFEGGEAITLESDGRVTLYFLLPGQQKVVALLPQLEEGRSNSLNLILTLVFYAIVIALLLMWLYPLIQRLNKLDNAASQFGQGNLASRVQPKATSYIHGIEQSFNTMASRIQRLLDDNRLLSRAVSHDLKTPLARLRFGLDALSESQKPERRAYYEQRIDQDLEEMESLVSTLLQYAALEDSPPNISKQLIDLESFCQQKYPSLTSDGIDFRLDTKALHANKAGSVVTDQRYLSMILANLINNARRFARSQVVLSLAADAENIVLTVDDDGPGVPIDQRGIIFKPFQRGTSGEGESELLAAAPKNHGMGLAIASRLASWLQADLSVGESHSLGGASFVLRLPKGIQVEGE